MLTYRGPQDKTGRMDKLSESFVIAVDQLVDVLTHMQRSNYSVLLDCDGHIGEYTGLSIDIEKKELTLLSNTESDTWRAIGAPVLTVK